MCLDEVYSSWSEFAKIVQTEIFPIYTSHEEKFDQYGIHGKMLQKTEQAEHLNGSWRTVKRSMPHTFDKGK